MTRTEKTSNMKIALKISSGIMHLFLTAAFYIIVFMFLVKAVVVVYNFSYQIFGDVSVDEKPGRKIEIEINKGESTMSVAKKLELKRVIVDKYSFYMKAKITNQSIKPGKYKVNTSMNYDEIFKIITTVKKGTS